MFDVFSLTKSKPFEIKLGISKINVPTSAIPAPDDRAMSLPSKPSTVSVLSFVANFSKDIVSFVVETLF